MKRSTFVCYSVTHVIAAVPKPRTKSCLCCRLYLYIQVLDLQHWGIVFRNEAREGLYIDVIDGLYIHVIDDKY